MRTLARLAALVAIAAPVVLDRPAHADALTEGEIGRIGRGQTVSRRQDAQQGPHRYVGGVAYNVVDMGPDDVTALLFDVGLWKRLIPRVRDARRITNVGDDPRVEVSNGNAIFHVTYTLRVRREGRVVRFWMDPTMPHDIGDVWGFFRPEALPDGRTLITFGILIDMGDGLLRDLFERDVQEIALEIPDNVRTVVVERTSRGRRAAR